ncbi:hypothetical protein PUN28_010148 [Cardiocondyla obscurior]|uniref:Uncharacterized protein n=1 Tax=Cardiocondyla obscurior TaxID=286306 RepID=A0AAW2FNU8_9HYME
MILFCAEKSLVSLTVHLIAYLNCDLDCVAIVTVSFQSKGVTYPSLLVLPPPFFNFYSVYMCVYVFSFLLSYIHFIFSFRDIFFLPQSGSRSVCRKSELTAWCVAYARTHGPRFPLLFYNLYTKINASF